MEYAKLIDGELVKPPRNKENIFNYDKNEEALIADGYKPIIEETPPQGNYVARFVETDDAIITEWEEVIPEGDAE